MTLLAAIDRPAPTSLQDPLQLPVEGWLWAGERDAGVAAVEILLDGRLAARTALRFDRPDVRAAHGLPAAALTGFAALLSAPEILGQPTAHLECRARFHDGASLSLGTRDFRLVTHDHRREHYGILLEPAETRLFHRADIYTSGASVPDANADCLALVRRYLGAPPVAVLDVGCGFGAYGRPLLAAGYDWLGVEVKPSDCAELARLGLPHRLVDGRTLPFADRAFDSAICIEVLEHIPDPDAFLAEIARTVRRRLLVSVPNVELIPLLRRLGVVPWHLLEGDHRNFFTRASLRALLARHFAGVEVLSYGALPLHTPEGLPLHNHLFAVCTAQP